MNNLTLSKDKKPNVNEAINLYLEAGWGTKDQYDTDRFEKAFKNSHFITAYSNGDLVGFVRYLTDGSQDTIVNEFIVSKPFQKQGIGKAILDKLQQTQGNTDIYINTPKEAENFFTQNGMKQQKCLVQVNRKKQSKE